MPVSLTVSTIVTVVAAVDAARGAHWDQFAMLVTIGVLTGAALVLTVARGPVVRPRADLVRWVQRHAAETDDDPRLVVDRALAAYRAAMLPDPPR